MQSAMMKKAADQRREAGHAEYSKAVWVRKVDKLALLAIVARDLANGCVVTQCRPGKARNATRGKGAQAQGPASLIATQRGMLRW